MCLAEQSPECEISLDDTVLKAGQTYRLLHNCMLSLASKDTPTSISSSASAGVSYPSTTRGDMFCAATMRNRIIASASARDRLGLPSLGPCFSAQLAD